MNSTWRLEALVQAGCGAAVLVMAIYTAARYYSRGAILLAVYGTIELILAVMLFFGLWNKILNALSTPRAFHVIEWGLLAVTAARSIILVAAAALLVRDFSRRPLPAEAGPAYRVEPGPPDAPGHAG